MNIKKLQQKMTKITMNFVIFVMVFGVAFNMLPQPHLDQNGHLSFEPALNPAYASIAYVGGTSNTGASASYSVDMSGLGLAAGDLVIVVNGFVSTVNGDPGVSTSGYTEISDLYANDTRDANMSVNWKIMGATPDTSVACNGSGSATDASVCLVYAWRGVDQSSPMDVTENEDTGTNSSVPDGPFISPVTNGATIVVAGIGTGVSVDTSVTAPSGYSNQVNDSADAGNAVIGAVVSKAWTSGDELPAAWTDWTTSTSDSWASVAMALRPAYSTATWNATSWTLYDTITIDADQVDATLTDFPVYVDLADLSSQFWSTTPTSTSFVGTDIRITTNDGSPVELSRELVAASSTAQTGELHFKANSISSTTDTVFRVYYNGTTTGDYAPNATYGSQNVWTNGYAAVYHLNEEGNNDAAGYRDSTVFGNHGTGTSMTAASDVAGVLGKGQDFVGSSNHIQTIGSASLGFAGTSSMSVWVNATGTTQKVVAISHDGSGADTYDTGRLQLNSGGTFGYQVMTGNGATFPTASGGTPSDNTWYHLTGVMTTSGATNTIDLYQDGVYQGSNSVNPVITNQSSYLTIAALYGGSQEIGGLVDEVRVASTSRSAAWIKAEYTNQATTTDFYTAYVNVSTWNATSWTTYDTITIDATQVDATLTDFPVYVDLSDLSSQFWSTTPSSASYVGTDIRVTTNDGSPVELPRELVAASSTAQTGELHFKANSISSTTDTVFRIYYNGTTTGYYLPDDTYGAENVWTNGYVAVYHLNEEGNTNADGYKDSTVFANHGIGTSMTAASDVAGVLGKGQDFIGSDPDYIQVDSLLGAPFNDVTLSSWVSADSVDTGGSHIVSMGNHIQLELSTGGVPEGSFYKGTWPTLADTGNDVRSAGWYYQTFTFDDTANSQVLYVDGLLAASSSDASSITWSGLEDNVQIGRHGGLGTTFDFDGILDEVRVSTSTRSAAWIAAEYTNQSTTTDFYNTAAAVLGSSTISNHVAGQVSNAFSSQNKTNEALFAFKLTPNSGNATTTQLELEVSGYSYQKLNTTDFTNIRLYRDMDNDAAYDATDIQVGGSGTFSLWSQNNQYGTIVFTDDFLATTSQNFVVVADWNAPANGSYMTIGLVPGGLDMQDNVGTVIVDGSVSSIQHNRYRSGGGGGSSAVGGDAPAGDGDVGGGGQTGGGQIDTNTGGNTIGGSPDFYWPTAQSGSWNNGANAIDQVDGTYATTSSSANHEFTDYNDSVPGSDTINGIEVKLELSGTTAAGNVGVQLSWDGGTSWTTTKNTPTLTTTDYVVSVGGPSDTWSRTWSVGEFSNSNFRVRLIGNPSTNEIRVDALQVKIYHQSSGGGSGGGGGGGAI